MSSVRRAKSLEFGLPLALSHRGALLVITAFGLVIRLYLSLTAYCISGDGVGYLTMARHFAASQWANGLHSVFSPLYPLTVAAAHPLVGNWELTGDLVSALFGTAAIVSVYLMTLAASGRRDAALGAAIIMAIHPEMSAYSASVRTESGYIFFVTLTSWLVLKALKDGKLRYAALGGLSAGLGYLYRTEGIGFLPLGIMLFGAAAVVWRRISIRWAVAAGAAFAAAFIVVAAPYISYLRISTEHWTIGREFTAAMMYGIGDVARNSRHWYQLGFSPAASPLAAVAANPGLYAEKVASAFAASIYGWIKGMGPVLTAALAFGLWWRGRALLAEPGEAFLLLVVIFYCCGFSLSYTGTRFMLHLVPFTFGWVAVGILAAGQELARMVSPPRAWLAHGAIPAAIALVLLPRTLWPIGYDMRGVRAAGQDIARIARSPAAVAARDGRVAYYAGTRLVELPPSPVGNFCGWLAAHDGVQYLVIGNRDEQRFRIAADGACLQWLKRYPRYRSGYYDLFAIRQQTPVRVSSGLPGPAAQR